MSRFENYTLTQKTDELRRLILENPELPIVVLANEESACDYWGWTFCSSISFHIEEILDYDFYDYDDRVFTDRERLEEKIGDDLYDNYYDKSDDEYVAAINRELTKYEPYWKKVIAIYATN